MSGMILGGTVREAHSTVWHAGCTLRQEGVLYGKRMFLTVAATVFISLNAPSRLLLGLEEI